MKKNKSYKKLFNCIIYIYMIFKILLFMYLERVGTRKIYYLGDVIRFIEYSLFNVLIL